VAAMTGILKKTAPAFEAGEVIVEQLHQ
jgi:hypothetical protein